jgi:GLEYA domain
MPISLIKKNQLDPNISDLVGQYGSGYFLPLYVSGQLTGFIASALSNITGVKLLNGLGGLINITGISGVDVSTNGLSSIVIAYTGIPVPPNLVYTTGTQTVSGNKDFVGRLTISGNPVSTGTNNLSNNGYKVYLDGNGMLNFPTSGVLGDSYGDGGITLLSPSGKYSELASNDGNVYAWVADTDYGNPYGGGFAIGTNHTGNGYVWYFGNDGLFHFPDGSIQTGAYTGIDLSSYATNENLNNLSGSLSGIYATYDQLTGLSGYEASVTNLLATYDQLTGYSGFQATVDAAFATYSQLTGLSGYGAAVTDLATTGSTLSSLIGSLSGTLTENYTTLTGLQTGLSGIAQVAIAYSMLSAQVYTSGLSGYINKNFYTNNNPSGFITGVMLTGYVKKSETGLFITSGQTGAFYPINNPSGFITGVENLVYTTGNQTISGNKTFSEDLLVEKSGFFRSGIKIGNSSIYITENRIDGGYEDNSNLIDGLLGIQYSGYFDNDPIWFATAAVKPIINEIILTGSSEAEFNGIYTKTNYGQSEQGVSYYQGDNGNTIYYYSTVPAIESYWHLNYPNTDSKFISYDLETWIQNPSGPFGSVPPTTNITQTQNFENSTNFGVGRALSNGTSWEWVGYFKPQNTANHNFSLYADENAYFWIGDKAVNGYITGNADMYSTAYNESNITDLFLTSGINYPVRMQWGHPSSPTTLGLSLYYNDGVNGNNNFSGVFFHGGIAKGFYIDAISGNASFAGNINANTATFNNLPTVSGNALLTGVAGSFVTVDQTGIFATIPQSGSYYVSLIPNYDTISVTSTDGSDNPLEMTLYKSSQVVGYFNQTFSGNYITQTVLTNANSGVLSTWDVTYDQSGKFLSVTQS